jgi:hypothetical protein
MMPAQRNIHRARSGLAGHMPKRQYDSALCNDSDLVARRFDLPQLRSLNSATTEDARASP